MNNRLKIMIACALLALVIVPTSLLAQSAPATSVFNYPGAGVICAGDVWESFLPQGTTPNYSEAASYTSLGVRRFCQMGNFDRGWTTPATHWPSAFYMTPYWFKDMNVEVYDPDTTWNRGPASANPSFFALDAGPSGNYSNFAQLTYKSTLFGATDPTRKYSVEPYFVDNATRQHVVYEAGWPTNLGVDVKFRAHGFAAPNWDNLNDYVIVEIQLTNTGFLDMNMDGNADNGITTHDIQALAFQIEEQSYMSISSYACGGRCVNDIVPTIYARQAGFINDQDSSGSPWAFSMMIPSCTSLAPTPGNFDMGFLGGTTKNYMDTRHGWVMLDVKEGALPANRAQSTSGLPSKQTIFGTDPIGTGAQRGWYMSAGSSYWAGSLSDPEKMFYISTGVWYANGGQLSHNTDFTSLNLNPDPNFFASGTQGNPLTFVPKVSATPLQPKGDYKSTNHFDEQSWEDGSADAATKYSPGWGKWTLGCSHTENFDDDMFTGLGPFSLKHGESITIVLATVAGYRLEGMQHSVRAARFCYQSNFQIPTPPPLPNVKISNTLNKSVAVEWDKSAETDPLFAGYKIWKSSQFKKLAWLNEGFRVVDQYEQQMTVGTRPANLYKPVNPKFDAFAKTNTNSTQGNYQPDTWGTWDLIQVIPKANLGTLTPAATSSFASGYRYEDKDVILGFQYWWYVSAYKEGTFAGPGGDVTGRIETHSTNRNGANGLWYLTFPFAYNNANYPASNATLLRNLGGAQVVTSALAPRGDVSRIGVRPNPYKKTALFDNRSQVYDHKIVFYNLPPQCKITILDVSGQIIDVINFVSNDPSKGSVFWDMFSKDGIEVASGVYIYVVQSPTGNHVGQFAILR